MKSNHKFVLTIVAALGLLILGAPTASAKEDNARHTIPTPAVKIAKSAELQKNQVTDENKDKSKSLNQNKPKNLVYDHVKMPSKPIKDNDHQDIGNMKKFIVIRKPYLYKEIGGNTRDLGGYLTADHKYETRADKIIRSADLDSLSQPGLRTLEKLHVNKIVDLRYEQSNDGIEGHPDPDELKNKNLTDTNINYQIDPVYSYNESNQFNDYMKKNGVHGEFYYYGAPSVTESQAIKSYRQIFHDLLNNKHGAILYHCNLGRDRTGTTSALILSALGVDRNVIYHDYLLTDHYHYNYRPGNALPYTKQAGELSYFFKVIDQKYGNVDNYLHRVIGLNHRSIEHLRRMYLTPVKGHHSIKLP